MANPEFNSRGGTYDRQTEVTFGMQQYREFCARTFVGALSKRNDLVAGKTAHETTSFDGSTFIWTQNISSGDEHRVTFSENARGMGAYGDRATPAGDFVEFKSQDFRVNTIKAPAQQIHGRESQKLVRASITNIPEIARRNLVTWHAQEINYDAIIALLYGADKPLMSSLADGGKAVSLGPGSGIGAGTPLMGMHWYTTDTGFATYDASDLSGWNTTVNNAINGIDAADSDKVTLAQMDKIRQKLDELHFEPGRINGKEYKAVALCDPQVVLRIGHILKDDYKYARERGKDNPIFNVNYQIEHDDVLYLGLQDLKKFRPAYNAATGYIDIGPGLTQDPRDYSTSSTNGLIIYMGSGALLQGTDTMLEFDNASAKFKLDGESITAHTRRGFKRNQWETKDGRTESYCRSVLTAAFYEPGIDWS